MSRKLDRKILLLLANGFSEAQATLYISELRAAGLPLKTLGLTKRPVRSEHGVEILPDLSIDTVIRTPPQIKLLILPGGKATASAWRADPRTRLLLDLVRNQGGYLVVAPEMVGPLESVIRPNFPLQLCENLSVTPFTAASALPVFVAAIDHNAAPKEFVQSLVRLCAE